MCICGGVGEAAIIVVTSGLVARRLLKRKPKPPQKTCPKCGAPQARLMYNSDLCHDCYYEVLRAIEEKTWSPEQEAELKQARADLTAHMRQHAPTDR